MQILERILKIFVNISKLLGALKYDASTTQLFYAMSIKYESDDEWTYN